MLKIKNALTKLFSRPKFSLIIDVFSVVIVIYCQADALLFSISDKARIIEFLFLFLVFFVLSVKYIALNKPLSVFNSKIFVAASFFSIIVLLSLLINITNLFNIHRYFFTIINLFLSAVIVLTIEFKRFVQLYIVILSVFAFLSLIIFGIYLIDSSFLSFMPRITNVAGYNFNFCIFSSVLIKDKIGLNSRNFGLFREPGVYAIFLLISLILCLFKGKEYFKNNLINLCFVVITSITILSTGSTTGILCLFFVLLLFFYWKVKSRTKLFWIGSAFVFLLISFSLFCILIKPPFIYNNEFLYLVFAKFDLTNESFSSRFFDQFATLLCSTQNPLTGLGWGNHYTYITKLSSAYNVPSNGGTNTFLLFFSVYGCIFGTLFSIFCYKSLKKIDPSSYIGFFLFIILVIALSSEDMTNNIFVLLFPLFTILTKEQRAIVYNYEEITI